MKGLLDPKNGNIKIDPKELAGWRTAIYLYEQINKYNGLTRSAKDVRKWLRERTVTC